MCVCVCVCVCCWVQGLHDHAIEKRSQLKFRMEEEQQKQDLTDSKLCNEQQTSVLRKKMALYPFTSACINIPTAEQALLKEQKVHQYSMER